MIKWEYKVEDSARIDFEDIKATTDILAVARDLGIELTPQSNGYEYRGKSIFEPGENGTCFSLNTHNRLWHDFKVEKGGSVIDLVAFVKYGNNDKDSFYKSLEYLNGGSLIDAAKCQEYRQQRDKFRANVNEWHGALLKDSSVIDYLHSRRISDKIIEENMLGLANEWISIDGEPIQELRLVFPYFNESYEPVYESSRALPQYQHVDKKEKPLKYHKAKQNAFLKNCPFGLETMPKKDSDCDLLIIGEGFVDALSCKQEGYKILFSGGGRFGRDNEEIVIRYAKKYQKIVLMFDSDSAGSDFTVYMGNLLMESGIIFECVRNYGEGNKDISDFYTNGGDISELIENAVDGYVFLAERLRAEIPFKRLSYNDRQKQESKLKDFLKSVKSFLYDEDFETVIQKLKEYYPAKLVEKYSKPPTQQEILSDMRDRFLKEHLIFFHGSNEHGVLWEYSECWNMIKNKELENEIYKFFYRDGQGQEESVKTIKLLAEMIRIKTYRATMPKFNSKPIINFANGVLELDTGIFRDARPDDYSSYQVKSRYMPGVRNEKWEKFLNDITCNNPGRLKVIRNMLGYLLYEDCRLHKMFFLIGRGRNGKSTLCNIISRLFENVNERSKINTVTNVSPAKLDDDTKTIHLMHSRVNICDDMKPYLSVNIVEPLKILATGNYLMGNLKFHDSIRFKPNAKHIFCCQSTPTIPDTSLGIKERLVFINFNADFSKNPNRTIENEIMENPEGIFNYILDCYHELIKQGDIIPYEADQREIMLDFVEGSNSIAAFWADYKEELEGTTQSIKNIYSEKYKTWAKDLNIRQILTLKKFSKSLRELCPEIEKRHKRDGEYFIIPTSKDDTVDIVDTVDATPPTPEIEPSTSEKSPLTTPPTPTPTFESTAQKSKKQTAAKSEQLENSERPNQDEIEKTYEKLSNVSPILGSTYKEYMNNPANKKPFIEMLEEGANSDNDTKRSFSTTLLKQLKSITAA